MSWLTLAALAVIIGIVTAVFLPSQARYVLGWFNRAKYSILVIVGIATAFYLLSTGVTFLIIIGMVGLIIGAWQFWFNDPLGWLRPFLPI